MDSLTLMVLVPQTLPRWLLKNSRCDRSSVYSFFPRSCWIGSFDTLFILLQPNRIFFDAIDLAHRSLFQSNEVSLLLLLAMTVITLLSVRDK